MFYMEHSVHLWANHSITYIHVNILYLWTINISNITWSIWNTLLVFATLRIYVASMPKKMAHFFSLILSLVQFTRAHTWDDDSQLHIFFTTCSCLFSIWIPCPSQTRITAGVFSAHYLKGQSVYLKGQEYPQATQPLMSPLTRVRPQSQCLTSGFPNTSKSVFQYT